MNSNRLGMLSDFDFELFVEILKQNGIKASLSSNPGNSFCNNVYYHGLKAIAEHNLKTEMCFVHVPYEDKISDYEAFGEKLAAAMRQLINR